MKKQAKIVVLAALIGSFVIVAADDRVAHTAPNNTIWKSLSAREVCSDLKECEHKGAYGLCPDAGMFEEGPRGSWSYGTHEEIGLVAKVGSVITLFPTDIASPSMGWGIDKDAVSELCSDDARLSFVNRETLESAQDDRKTHCFKFKAVKPGVQTICLMKNYSSHFPSYCYAYTYCITVKPADSEVAE
jgi:hypothetical protein